MPDLDATHGIIAAVTGTGGAGLMGGFMAFLRGKEAREMRDAFIALQGTVQRLADDVKEMKAMSANVTRTSDKADSLHKRVDELDDSADELKESLVALTARVTALESKRHR